MKNRAEQEEEQFEHNRESLERAIKGLEQRIRDSNSDAASASLVKLKEGAQRVLEVINKRKSDPRVPVSILATILMKVTNLVLSPNAETTKDLADYQKQLKTRKPVHKEEKEDDSLEDDFVMMEHRDINQVVDDIAKYYLDLIKASYASKKLTIPPEIQKILDAEPNASGQRSQDQIEISHFNKLEIIAEIITNKSKAVSMLFRSEDEIIIKDLDSLLKNWRENRLSSPQQFKK